MSSVASCWHTSWQSNQRQSCKPFEYANGGFGTQIYSQLQAFSPDNSYLILIESGNYVVRRLDDLSQVALDSSGWNAARWHSGLPNTIVHYDSNKDQTLRVQYTDVASQQDATFPAQYQRIRSKQSFDELSHDGRWMAGMVPSPKIFQPVKTVSRPFGASIDYESSCLRLYWLLQSYRHAKDLE